MPVLTAAYWREKVFFSDISYYYDVINVVRQGQGCGPLPSTFSVYQSEEGSPYKENLQAHHSPFSVL